MPPIPLCQLTKEQNSVMDAASVLSHGMVCGPQPYAVDAGVDILRQGGNAVDAALAAALVQGVVDPHMCGPGGYLLLTLQRAGERTPLVLDAPALAGSKVRADMWADHYIRPNPMGWGYFLRDQVNDAGYTSICTPGSVMGMHRMQTQWGTLPWADLFPHAIAMAEDGHRVMDRTARVWQRRAESPEELAPLDYIHRNPEASRVYLRADGHPPRVNEWFRNPDFGRTLRRLAEAGAEDFYTGELAARMAADLEAQGSFVTGQDLRDYALPEVEPVHGEFGEYRITTAPAPHGGATLVAILNIMETFRDEPGLEPHSPRYLYLLGMAMKAAFADRNPHMADTRHVDVPLAWMTDRARAEYWHDVITRGETIRVAFDPPGSKDTTHITTVDRWGNCVALTHSLGSSSGVITPGLGFMYNNSMVNFHPLPGHPNSIAPGKGRTTGMAPTIVTHRGQPILALGAPGSTKIITSVAQVILNVLLWGMNVAEAVHAPRIDSQGDAIELQARIPHHVCAEIGAWHPVKRLAYSHGGMALVHAIAIDAATGRVTGGADTGTDGMAVAV